MAIGSNKERAQEDSSTVAESITITDNRTGNQLEIPINHGGVAATEWQKLLPGIWFYDPGLTSTAVCESTITFVDGDVGILRYRGYPIEQLAAELQLSRGGLPAAARRAPQRRRSSASGVTR